MRLAGRVTGGCESPALAAWLLPGGLFVRRPIGLRKEKPGRRAQPRGHTALSGHLLPVLPVLLLVALWTGAAAGSSPPTWVLPSLTGLWAPVSDCSCALLFMTLGEPLVQRRGDLVCRSHLPLPSRVSRPRQLRPCLLMGCAHVAGRVQVMPWGQWEGRGWPRGGLAPGPPVWGSTVSLTTGHAGAPGQAAHICTWVCRRFQNRDFVLFPNRILSQWFWVVTRLSVTLRRHKKLPDSRLPRFLLSMSIPAKGPGLALAMLLLCCIKCSEMY